MTLVRFFDHYGELSREVEAPAGSVLLHVAQQWPTREGLCEGPWHARLQRHIAGRI